VKRGKGFGKLLKKMGEKPLKRICMGERTGEKKAETVYSKLKRRTHIPGSEEVTGTDFHTSLHRDPVAEKLPPGRKGAAGGQESLDEGVHGSVAEKHYEVHKTRGFIGVAENHLGDCRSGFGKKGVDGDRGGALISRIEQSGGGDKGGTNRSVLQTKEKNVAKKGKLAT